MKNSICTKALLLIFMAVCCLSPAAQAFTSPYSFMTAAGEFTGWSLTNNYMELVSDNTWQVLTPISRSSSAFLFAADKTFSHIWKETNQVTFVAPLTGTAEYNAGSDIQLNDIVQGNYLFTINDSSGAYSVTRQNDANLIRNGTFEEMGNNDETARYWEWEKPDKHGSYWGSAARMTYRSHEGSYEGAIRGTWAGKGSNGGFWQDTPAAAGFGYELSAWFWVDDGGGFGTFTADIQELKVEFLDANYSLIEYAFISVANASESWTNISVYGVAPENTAWARAVIFADGIGVDGSLQFDEVVLKKVSARQQNFENWNDDDFSVDGCHTQDWILCEGSINTNAASGTVIISEYIEGSSFNKAVELYNSTPDTISLTNYVLEVFGFTGSGSTWHKAYTPTGLLASGDAYVLVANSGSTSTNLTALADELTGDINNMNGDDSLVLKQGGTNGVILDSFGRVGEDPSGKGWGSGDIATWDHTLVRKSFVTFGDTNPTNSFDPADEWMGYPQDTFDGLGSHTMGSGSGPDGNFAEISETIGSYIRGGSFAEGVGSISFWYRHESGTSPALDYLIQISTNGTDWATVGSVSNITSAAWKQYTLFIYQPDARYVRLYHSAGAKRLYMDDISVALPVPIQMSQNFDSWSGSEAYGCHEDGGWQVCTGKVVSTDARSGLAAWVYPGTGNYFMSPGFSNGIGEITFWYRSETPDTTTTFNVQMSNNGSSWTTVTNGQSSSSSYQQFYLYAYETNTTYIRVILDTVGSALLIDDVEIGDPVLHRTQTFNEWPGGTSYGTSEFQGWRTEDGLIKSADAYSGQAVRFRDDGGTVSSPELLEGLGTVTFQYRRLSASGTDPVYALQTSPDGTAWTTFSNLTVTSTSYTEFEQYFFDETNSYFRIRRTSGSSGSSIAIFDEVSVAEPTPPADVSLTGGYDPELPFTSDQVNLQASVFSKFDADNIVVTGYYRIGTSGAFTALSMPEAGFSFYETSPSIPEQPTNTLVQFYIEVNFEGPGSFLTSPKYYPSNAPAELAWYGIPRARPGQVWINEIDPWNNFDGIWNYTNAEFVELAGPADFDLTDWQIELVDGQVFPYQTFDNYDIPAVTTLADEDNGYGFFVLGGPAQPARDLTLTNFLSQHRPGLVKLYNEMGGVEDSIPYEGFILGEGNLGVTDPDSTIVPYTNSVGLSGYGTNVDGFVWVAGLFTPGALNTGQAFGDAPPAPDFYIMSILVDTNVIITSTGTNAWEATPYYTTNLLSTPIQWTEITTFDFSYAGGVNTITFDLPVAGANCIFNAVLSLE